MAGGLAYPVLRLGADVRLHVLTTLPYQGATTTASHNHHLIQLLLCLTGALVAFEPEKKKGKVGKNYRGSDICAVRAHINYAITAEEASLYFAAWQLKLENVQLSVLTDRKDLYRAAAACTAPC